MMLVTLALAAYGTAMIYSATLGTEGTAGLDSHVVRQIVYLVVGLGILAALAATDYRVLSNVATPAYVTCVGLLGILFVIGRVTHGSRRWIPLGFIDLQPSELAKLALAIMLARYLASHQDSIRSARVIAWSAVLAAVPAALTFAQPDLGTGLVLVVIWLGMVVVAGLRWLHAGLMMLAGLAAAPIAWLAMPQYMKDRVDTFLNPEKYPLDQGYNVIQALISVGSGGLTGRGFTSGTQSQLHFLRVQYADFIFSVLAEELGFVGALVLLGLLAVLLLRGLRAAAISRDAFGRLLCVGIVSAQAFQTFVNVGMNAGLLPVTGVPLPLISYGGSSALTVLIGIGILESVAMRHKRFEL
jgi:rod shape determining protein RodA